MSSRLSGQGGREIDSPAPKVRPKYTRADIKLMRFSFGRTCLDPGEEGRRDLRQQGRRNGGKEGKMCELTES